MSFSLQENLANIILDYVSKFESFIRSKRILPSQDYLLELLQSVNSEYVNVTCEVGLSDVKISRIYSNGRALLFFTLGLRLRTDIEDMEKFLHSVKELLPFCDSLFTSVSDNYDVDLHCYYNVDLPYPIINKEIANVKLTDITLDKYRIDDKKQREHIKGFLNLYPEVIPGLIEIARRIKVDASLMPKLSFDENSDMLFLEFSIPNKLTEQEEKVLTDFIYSRFFDPFTDTFSGRVVVST